MMGGPGSGNHKGTPRSSQDEAFAALALAIAARRAATEARMQAVRGATSREGSVRRSWELWEREGVMLPLVLGRWEISEDEIRDGVSRPEVRAPLLIEIHKGWVPIAWTRRIP